MGIFTVHLPRQDYSRPAPDEAALAGAVFVPEGFSWRAFIFGPLWLIGRGLWLAFVVWLVVVIALSIVSALFLTSEAAFLIFFAIELFLGLEGNRLRRAELARRGYRLVEVIVADPQEAAERTFFRRWLEPKPSPPPLPTRVAPPSDPHSDVLGHFPLPEGRG